MNERICTSCRRRSAVYRRLASGEYLCIPCLVNGIVRQIRKALSYFAIVHRRDRALFIIRPDKVLESITALRLFRKASRDLELELFVLCVEDLIRCDVVEKYIAEHGLGTVVRVRVDRSYRPSTMVEMLKFVEAVALYIAKDRKLDVILTPLFRDELMFFAMLGLLMIEKETFAESFAVKQAYGSRISRPMYYVTSHDIAVLTYLDTELRMIDREISPFIVRSSTESTVFEHCKKIVYTSTELMYASNKSIELLQSFIIGPAMRCKYCLAPTTDDVDVCRYCKKFESILANVFKRH